MFIVQALLALNEKTAIFKERFVNIHGGDQYAEWFLRINKHGEVPVLQVGDQYTAGSEEVIDLIDKTFTSGISSIFNFRNRTKTVLHTMLCLHTLVFRHQHFFTSVFIPLFVPADAYQ